MSKLPAFQFYPADWRKDPGVQSLSFHDRGVWFEILCLMHESDQRGKLLLNGKPMPDEALARLLGLDKQILTKTITTLLDYGVASRCDETGALMNRRMVRDEALRKIRQEAGKSGGNPILLNQKDNQNLTTRVKQNLTTQDNQNLTTRDKQILTPSSSSSSSSSSSKTTAAEATAVPDDADAFKKNGNGKAKSCYTEDVCREYVNSVVVNRRAVRNPGGLAHTLYTTGGSDGEIREWIEAGRKQAVKKHPGRAAII